MGGRSSSTTRKTRTRQSSPSSYSFTSLRKVTLFFFPLQPNNFNCNKQLTEFLLCAATEECKEKLKMQWSKVFKLLRRLPPVQLLMLQQRRWRNKSARALGL